MGADGGDMPKDGFRAVLDANTSLKAFAQQRGYQPQAVVDANIKKGWWPKSDTDGTSSYVMPRPVFLPHKAPHQADLSTGQSAAITIPSPSDTTCPFCGNAPEHGKGWHCLYDPPKAEDDPAGKRIGRQAGTNKREEDTDVLIQNMWGEGKVDHFKKEHPFYMGKKSYAIHHIMSVSKVRERFWAVMFRHNGYNINCATNLVTLPSFPPTACELRIPLHRSSHSGRPERTANLDYDETEPTVYHDAVKDALDKLYKKIVNGKLCGNGSGAIQTEMDKLAKGILKRVVTWDLALTKLADFFSPGSDHGCCGKIDLKGIKATSGNCPDRVGNLEPGQGFHASAWAKLPLEEQYGKHADKIAKAKAKVTSASSIKPADEPFLG